MRHDIDPGIAMSNVKASNRALILFGFLALFASGAFAQCTPVVYAFRHAEDTNPPNPPGPQFTLTPSGDAHAKLYPAMVTQFGSNNGFCAVAKVYATTKAQKVGSCGTQCTSATNAYDTAVPLAASVGQSAPITKIGSFELYEFVGNGDPTPTTPKYDTATAKALREELLATANSGKSSAIFWTSQGLHAGGIDHQRGQQRSRKA